jgi:hypothetical protein
MSPAESLREKLIYFLEYAPHLKDRTPEERRAEGARMVDAYAHELAKEQRAYARECGTPLEDGSTVSAGDLIDLIDPNACPERPGEERGDERMSGQSTRKRYTVSLTTTHWDSLLTAGRLRAWVDARQMGITIKQCDRIADAAVAGVRELVDEWAQQQSAGSVRPDEEPTT